MEPVGRRRRFSAAYKVRILAEADACESGMLGALLRREGLYYTSIQKWRKLRAEGMLEGLTPRKRGPAPDPDRALKQRNAQLEKENQRLQKRLPVRPWVWRIWDRKGHRHAGHDATGGPMTGGFVFETPRVLG